jgi:HAD superfamily hydrolase (TIGR01509 family)
MTPLPSRAFLFDLDGVLVRSEELHHEAYREACARHGRALDWTFARYCVAAHYGPERLQEELRVALPGLLEGVGWSALYAEKSRLYLELLAGGGATLQPGAATTLERLATTDAKRAVVTNSTREQTALLRAQHPALASVREWVTREDYAAAKPAPDSYALALHRLGAAAADAVGLEDTPRGLQALAAAGVTAVLVTRIDYPDLGPVAPALRVPDLAALPAGWLA